MRKFNSPLVRVKLFAVGAVSAIALLGWMNSPFSDFRATASRSGPVQSHTNAPGERNCTACHSDFAVNSGSGAVRIAGLPVNYTPGKKYPLTVTVADENATIFGFQATSLDNQNQGAGDWQIPNTTPAPLKILTGLINGNQRKYVEHTRDGVTPPAGTFNTKSWTFDWVAPAARIGKISIYAAGNAANSDGSTRGDYIYTQSASVCSGAVESNFDGDSKSDLAVFRRSNNTWYNLSSKDNSAAAVQFGKFKDKPVAADFDGDGKNDRAVWRPSNGTWYIQRSSDNQSSATQFGEFGDVPVIGDFTGDARADLVVFRPSSGVWLILNSADNTVSTKQFGMFGDKPVSGDFDADGKNDFAVYRPSTGTWEILRSTAGLVSKQFGLPADRPLSGDFDGDGKADIAVFRASNSTWYLLNSSSDTLQAKQFGAPGDTPVPTDYDGDCKTDLAVFRGGEWQILNSADDRLSTATFGSPGDVPIASIFSGYLNTNKQTVKSYFNQVR